MVSMASRDAVRVLCGDAPLSLATPGVNGPRVSATRLPRERLSGANVRADLPGGVLARVARKRRMRARSGPAAGSGQAARQGVTTDQLSRDRAAARPAGDDRDGEYGVARRGPGTLRGRPAFPRDTGC